LPHYQDTALAYGGTSLNGGHMTTPILDDVKRATHRGWWALVLRGLLGIAVGVLIFMRPLDSVAAFALVIAWWALVIGIVDIVRAFELRPIAQHWWLLLLAGVVSVGFGVAALYYYPGLSLTFAVVLFAWWLTFGGAIAVYAAVQQKKLGMAWGWSAVAAALSIVAGVFALLVPPATLAAIMGLIAAYAIVSGAMFLAAAFKLRSVAHPAGAMAR
jgi:uncharacterized membrane protein HdeD (DUF308 family)